MACGRAEDRVRNIPRFSPSDGANPKWMSWTVVTDLALPGSTNLLLCKTWTSEWTRLYSKCTWSLITHNLDTWSTWWPEHTHQPDLRTSLNHHSPLPRWKCMLDTPSRQGTPGPRRSARGCQGPGDETPSLQPNTKSDHQVFEQCLVFKVLLVLLGFY